MFFFSPGIALTVYSSSETKSRLRAFLGNFDHRLIKLKVVFFLLSIGTELKDGCQEEGQENEIRKYS